MTKNENEFGVVNVANDELKIKEIPPPRAGWPAICQFALTFDGYCECGSFDKCADIANKAIAVFHSAGKVPKSLVELRTCLFFEQRRWNHFGETPPVDEMRYIRALLKAIRENVAKRYVA
jgi:hypothetical protein